jgi:putative endonuclease
MGEIVLSNAWFVYILASQRNGTLYVGSTNDLISRVRQHRGHVFPSFTKTCKVTCLMWFEVHETMVAARYRERQIKAWKRQWKIDLFKDINPTWDDLYPALSAE